MQMNTYLTRTYSFFLHSSKYQHLNLPNTHIFHSERLKWSRLKIKKYPELIGASMFSPAVNVKLSAEVKAWKVETMLMTQLSSDFETRAIRRAMLCEGANYRSKSAAVPRASRCVGLVTLSVLLPVANYFEYDRVQTVNCASFGRSSSKMQNIPVFVAARARRGCIPFVTTARCLLCDSPTFSRLSYSRLACIREIVMPVNSVTCLQRANCKNIPPLMLADETTRLGRRVVTATSGTTGCDFYSRLHWRELLSPAIGQMGRVDSMLTLITACLG